MASIHFTARGIAAIKPPAIGRAEYWDSTMAGFGLRVSSTGVKSWMTMYRHKGRKRRHTLGTFPAMTLADAYELARRSLNEAANGKDPAGTKREDRLMDSFADLAHEYLERHAKPKKKSWKMDQYILEQDLLPRWRNQKARELKKRDVISLLDDVVGRGASIHANRVLALVRKIFNFGISRDIVEFNPCTAVPMPTKAHSRDRVLSIDEIKLFWASAEMDDPLIEAILKLRLLTAQRGGEIESMSWDCIDFTSAIWTIPAEVAKNGLSHRVPLSRPALDILKSLYKNKNDSPWVFPSPLGDDRHIENIQKAIQRVRKRKGFEVNFTGHDLRRTAASHMASNGVPRLVISKILNHAEKGITSVYDRHSYDAEKRTALDHWANRISDVVMEPCKTIVKLSSIYNSVKMERSDCAK